MSHAICLNDIKPLRTINVFGYNQLLFVLSPIHSILFHTQHLRCSGSIGSHHKMLILGILELISYSLLSHYSDHWEIPTYIYVTCLWVVTSPVEIIH